MQRYYDSPVGRILLESRDGRLSGLWFDRQAERTESCPVLEETAAWLDAYFAGRIPPRLPAMELTGPPFGRRVMELLLEIPYGEVITYGGIADRIAAERGIRKMSAQAVGQAVGRNPISILVPCHRVVAAHGKPGGYGGGLDRKLFLLGLEKRTKESLC